MSAATSRATGARLVVSQSAEWRTLREVALEEAADEPLHVALLVAELLDRCEELGRRQVFEICGAVTAFLDSRDAEEAVRRG